MGIYDREYYRDETGGSGWLSGVAPACKVFIVLNVALFLAPAILGGEFLGYLDARSPEIFERFQVWRLLTASFLNDINAPFLLLFNMLFLWFAGREMEATYGTRDFRVMYLGAAVVSALAWALFDYFGPQGPHSPRLLGASGPVTAVIVLYALYYPRREVLLFFILPVEIWILLVVYLGIQAFMLLQGPGSGEHAVANLTGALFGYLFKTFDLRWSRLNLQLGRRARPRFRVVHPEPRERESTRPGPSAGPTWSPDPAGSGRPATSAVVSEEALDARLDEVLAKIARDGRSALDDDDRRVLEEASRRAKNRRSERL